MQLPFKQSLIILSMLALFYSCTGKQPETIRIAVLYGPSAVSFLPMMENDTVMDGKKIEITILKEPQQVQALMMQGKTDFAILPTLMAANLYNKGVEYQMLACPVWGTLYILTNDTIHTLQGLKGRTISVLGQGATPDVLLRRVLDENGIINTKPDYTFTTHAEIAQALLMHKTSIAVVSEPIVSNLMSKDSTIHIVAKLTCEDKVNSADRDLFVQTAFLVSKRFSANNKSLVAKISKSYAASCASCNEQPENTAKLMLKYKLATDLAVAQRSLPLCNIHYVEASAINDKVFRFLTIFYQFNPKCLGNKMPDPGFVYR
ncbi:MAG: ABC transporter substrate-binding protein [Paludibacter sp.]|nr:ABC transporter substrate-binding protein [Paludibacter sp.]